MADTRPQCTARGGTWCKIETEGFECAIQQVIKASGARPLCALSGAQSSVGFLTDTAVPAARASKQVVLNMRVSDGQSSHRNARCMYPAAAVVFPAGPAF